MFRCTRHHVSQFLCCLLHTSKPQLAGEASAITHLQVYISVTRLYACFHGEDGGRTASCILRGFPAALLDSSLHV